MNPVRGDGRRSSPSCKNAPHADTDLLGGALRRPRSIRPSFWAARAISAPSIRDDWPTSSSSMPIHSPTSWQSGESTPSSSTASCTRAPSSTRCWPPSPSGRRPQGRSATDRRPLLDGAAGSGLRVAAHDRPADPLSVEPAGSPYRTCRSDRQPQMVPRPAASGSHPCRRSARRRSSSEIELLFVPKPRRR